MARRHARQWVGIAWAFAIQPEVLLKDEPFGALDEEVAVCGCLSGLVDTFSSKRPVSIVQSQGMLPRARYRRLSRIIVAAIPLGLAACGSQTKGKAGGTDASPIDQAGADVSPADQAVDVPAMMVDGGGPPDHAVQPDVGDAGDMVGTEAPPRAVCGSPGQGDAQDCEAASWLKLEDPSLPFAGDGTVARGQNIVFSVILANRGTQSFSRYPCVAFISDHPLIKFQAGSDGCQCRFAIFAGTTAEMSAAARVDPNIAPGTVVRVAANVAPLHGQCPGLSQVSLAVTVR